MSSKMIIVKPPNMLVNFFIYNEIAYCFVCLTNFAISKIFYSFVSVAACQD